jgi:hypothetical protein
MGTVIGEQIAECGLGKRKSEGPEIRWAKGPDSDSLRELRPIARHWRFLFQNNFVSIRVIRGPLLLQNRRAKPR